jgi:hypothetical protein
VGDSLPTPATALVTPPAPSQDAETTFVLPQPFDPVGVISCDRHLTVTVTYEKKDGKGAHMTQQPTETITGNLLEGILQKVIVSIAYVVPSLPTTSLAQVSVCASRYLS